MIRGGEWEEEEEEEEEEEGEEEEEEGVPFFLACTSTLSIQCNDTVERTQARAPPSTLRKLEPRLELRENDGYLKMYHEHKTDATFGHLRAARAERKSSRGRRGAPGGHRDG